MKVKIGKKEAKELKKYAKKSDLPFLTVVHFWVGEKKVGATNLEKGLVLDLDVSEGEDVDYFNLPERGMTLFEKQEELEVTVNKKATLKGNRFKVSFAQVEKQDIEIPFEVPPGTKVDKEKLLCVFKKVKEFRGKNEFNYNSYFLEKSGNTLTLFATDRTSFARGKIEVEGGEDFKVITSEEFKDILGSAKELFEEIELGLLNAFFYIKGDKGISFVSIKEVPWPEVEKLEEFEYKEIAVVDRNALKDGIEDVSLIFSPLDDIQKVKVEGKDGTLTLTAESEEGSADIQVEAEVKEEFTFYADAEMIEKILSSSDSEKLRLFLADNALKVEEDPESTDCPVEYFMVLLRE